MLLVVAIILGVPALFAFGWWIVGPFVGGSPPFTGPSLAAYVNVWCPQLRRRWPPYSQRERAFIRQVRRDRLGPLA